MAEKFCSQNSEESNNGMATYSSVVKLQGFNSINPLNNFNNSISNGNNNVKQPLQHHQLLQHRYMPYHSNSNYRSYSQQLQLPHYSQQQSQQQQQQFVPMHSNCLSITKNINNNNNNNINNSSGNNNNHECDSTINNGNEILINSGNTTIKNNTGHFSVLPASHTQNGGDNNSQTSVTLQISNLDYTMDEIDLRNFLLNQLKPITPVHSIIFESSSSVKVTVPDINYAKQVVSNLHRKKIGHRRMVVSYIRDSSFTEFNTLRCQVAGLLKDVPYCTLPIYKFRELFLSRFNSSISLLDLYKINDICTITTDKNDEKHIQLNPELINSIDDNLLMEGLQHSVPYCTIHFKRDQHKGWAEQDIEPLPNVFMTISEIQHIIYELLKRHSGDIPISSLVHCVEGELGIKIQPNDNGINLEHLICCAHGIQITTNNFGIKILSWMKPDNSNGKEMNENRPFQRSGSLSDPLYQLSREVIELIKMCPKSTLKFDRFIPAYHNLFGKQCRVADYGYTKLIEVLEALSSVVQVMGDGENRQLTLTHRTQIRRFTSDLLRIIRAQSTKSILLSQLPYIFSISQNRNFDITEYGVCNVVDILDGLVNSNIVVLTSVENDILISIPKRKQTALEIEKTSIFAGECVELLRNIPQYSVQFTKFVRSYHYHFGYQCRLSDYGFLKLTDLLEAIHGVVEIECSNDEDKKVFLSSVFARRVFAEQLEELILEFTGSGKTCMKLDDVLEFHKKKFGYRIQPQALGVDSIFNIINTLPYVEVLENDESLWIVCHVNDQIFRSKCYRACRVIQESENDLLLLEINDFKNAFSMKYKEQISDHEIITMKHAIEIYSDNDLQYVGITKLIKFLLRIVGILDKQFLTLSKIKSILNIDMTDCFEFGYPNLILMLKAFPDIFVVQMAANQEKSEISLVPKLILSSSKIAYNNHFRYRSNSDTINNHRYSGGRKLSSSGQILQDNNNYTMINTSNCNQSFELYGSNYSSSNILNYDEMLPFKYDMMINTNNCNIPQELINNKCNDIQYSNLKLNNYTSNFGGMNSMSMNMKNKEMQQLQNVQQLQQQEQQKENQLRSLSFLLPNNNNENNKENFYKNDMSKGSLNSSSGSDPNSSYGSVLNESTGEQQPTSSNLWSRRRDEKYMRNISNELLNIVIPPNPIKPPKPDTPATPNTNILWNDPIWKNTNRSPKNNNSPKIELPELKPYILPLLLSPYSEIKFENMMNDFTFPE